MLANKKDSEAGKEGVTGTPPQALHEPSLGHQLHKDVRQARETQHPALQKVGTVCPKPRRKGAAVLFIRPAILKKWKQKEENRKKNVPRTSKII